MLKVTHSELTNVRKVMDDDEKALDLEIEKMQKQIEKLKTIWQGQDADAFCKNYENFLLKMK